MSHMSHSHIFYFSFSYIIFHVSLCVSVSYDVSKFNHKSFHLSFIIYYISYSFISYYLRLISYHDKNTISYHHIWWWREIQTCHQSFRVAPRTVFSPKEKILELFLYTFQPRMFRKVLSKPKSKSSHCHRKCRRCAGTSHCLMFWWWMMVLVSPVLPWNTQIANQMLMIPFGYWWEDPLRTADTDCSEKGK